MNLVKLKSLSNDFKSFHLEFVLLGFNKLMGLRPKSLSQKIEMLKCLRKITTHQLS